MGTTISIFVDHFSNQSTLPIIMVGLEGAGKSTILYKIDKYFEPAYPSRLQNTVEIANYRDYLIRSWNFGTSLLFNEIKLDLKSLSERAIILVIDSSNKSRVEEAKEQLTKLLQEEELNDVPLLVMANKQDISGCLSIEELADKLGLHKITNRLWAIKKIFGLTGDGLSECFDYLEMMTNHNRC